MSARHDTHLIHRMYAGSLRRLVWLASAAAVFVSGCDTYHPQPIDLSQSAKTLLDRRLDDPGLKRFMEANGATYPTPGDAWSSPQLVLAGLYFNPTLAIARAQLEGAAAAEFTARGRPNPTLTPSLGYDENPGPGVTPWFPGFALDWTIETAGKRRARMDQAHALQESSRFAWVETAWSVRRSVRTAFLEASNAETKADVLRQMEGADARLLELLEQRLKAGIVSSPEVLSARLTRQRAAFDAGEAARQAVLARARLAEAIGVPAAAVLDIKLQDDGSAQVPPRLDDARVVALHSRPDVLQALSDYAAAEAGLRLQYARQYPDIHLGPGFLWDLGERKWSLGLTFEYPLPNDGPLNAALAQRNEQAARLLAAQSKALAELDQASLNHAQALAQLARARSVSDAARSQWKNVEAQEKAGELDALQAESAAVEYLNARLLELDAQAAVATAAAQWEDAVRQPAAWISRLASSVSAK